MQNPTERRKEIIGATTRLLAEVGSSKITHRLVAERADVPLGSTTYYFDSIDDLVGEALHSVAESTQADLDELERRLAETDDIPHEVSVVVWEDLQDHDHLVIWNELYTSALHQPELGELALLWSDGLNRILGNHMNPTAAEATAMFIDGILLRVTVSNDTPSFEVIEQGIRLLSGLDEVAQESVTSD